MIFRDKPFMKSECITFINKSLSSKNPDISIKSSLHNGVEYQTMILINVKSNTFSCVYRKGLHYIKSYIKDNVYTFDLSSDEFKQMYDSCINIGIVPDIFSYNLYPKPATNSKRFSAARH